MWVKQVQLKWQDRLSFTINPNFALSQIKYLDLEKNLDDSESPKEKMLSEIALLGPLYSELVDSLADSLGGLVEKQASSKAAAEELISDY